MKNTVCAEGGFVLEGVPAKVALSQELIDFIMDNVRAEFSECEIMAASRKKMKAMVSVATSIKKSVLRNKRLIKAEKMEMEVGKMVEYENVIAKVNMFTPAGLLHLKGVKGTFSPDNLELAK